MSLLILFKYLVLERCVALFVLLLGCVKVLEGEHVALALCAFLVWDVFESVELDIDDDLPLVQRSALQIGHLLRARKQLLSNI